MEELIRIKPREQQVPAFKEPAPRLVKVGLGSLKSDPQKGMAATPEAIFGAGLLILGESGSGKSCTVSRFLDSCRHYTGKAIVLDLCNAFVDGPPRAEHVKLCGTATEGRRRFPFETIPNSMLQKYLGAAHGLESQLLNSAIRSLIIAKFMPELAPDGLLRKSGLEAEYIQQIEDALRPQFQSQYLDIDIRLLPTQIELECCQIIEGKYQAPDMAIIEETSALRMKIIEFLSTQGVNELFFSEDASLLSSVTEFLDDDEKRVLCINAGLVPNALECRGFFLRSFLHFITEVSRTGIYRDKPLLLFIDGLESLHINGTFTKSVIAEISMRFEELSRSGISLIVTCGSVAAAEPLLRNTDINLIVHALTQSHDRSLLKTFRSEVDDAALNEISALDNGQAYVSASDTDRPYIVKIFEPLFQPTVRIPSFQKSWKNPTK